MVSAKENDEITLYLFHGDGCPHCASEQEFLDTIKDDYPDLKIEKYEVWYNDENAELLGKVEAAFSKKRSGVPLTVIGSTVISGFGPGTDSRIERAIKYYQENDYEDEVQKIKDGTFIQKSEKEETVDPFTEEEKKTDEEVSISVPFFGNVNLKNISLLSSAVLIGLIDGFNPCAMWILLFLIGILIGMKDRKKMWCLGLTFLITSALVYMVIMLSWIQVVVKMTALIWIRNMIAIVALIGAFINLKSFFTSPDSGCQVVDDKKRKKILTRIKKFTSEKNFLLALLGIMGLAVSVNLVELACSAGLPIVFSELLVLNSVDGGAKFLYTLVYIFFFLIDDLVVFMIAMFTMKVTGISTKYNKYSHLLGGIIMLIVGVLLLVKPEWLMFNW